MFYPSHSRIVQGATLTSLVIALAGMAFGQGTVSSVVPNAAPTYSPATVVTITGSGFASGSSVIFSPPGGPVTPLNPSQIQAAQIASTIPASLLTSAGTAQIAVQNGAGVLSNQVPFTIAGPTATTVTPGSALAHSRSAGIVISGANIVSTSVVSFTPPGGTRTTVTPSQVQAAQIAATIPAALLTTAGTAQIAIQNGPGSLSNQLPFTIGPSVSVKAQTLTSATAGLAYSDVVTASGGKAPYTWTVLSGAVPPGLSLAASGTVSGNPTIAGPGIFAVQAVDATGAVANGSVSINVKPQAFNITTGAFPQGVVNFDYPQQILVASGGSAPYTFALTTGTLPAGLTLSSGIIGGVPTTAATSSFTLTATDSAGVQAKLDASIVIRPAGSDLVLLSGSVAFALATGANAVPLPQSVGVQSANVAQTLNYTTATSTATWLSVSGGGTTPGALIFSVTPAALSLPAGTSTATVTLTCTTTACAGKTQSIAVTLVVTSPPPQLSILNGLLAFRSTSTPAQAQSQPLGIVNSGGGSLAITSITCETSWCTIGSVPALVVPGPGGQVVVTVDPSTLKNGFYRTAVDVTTSAGSISVPVTFLVSSTVYTNLSQSGNQFDMQATGAPGNPNGSFLINASGGTFNWTASVLPGSGWLTLNTASGTASDAQPGNISYTVDSTAANLTAKTYYATIQVASGGAINTPLSYVVVLNVVPATQPPTLLLSSGGLFFVTNVGVAPPAQTLSVYTNSKASQAYQAAASTDTGSWLSAPASGTTSSTTPGQSAITVDPSSLTTPGVYLGRVSYALGGAGIRTANIVLLLLPTGVNLPSTVMASLAPEAAVPTPRAACSPTAILLAHSGQPGNFSAPASWPTQLAMTLLNDCGKAVTNGQVVATFSNGDAPLALSLATPTSGLYTGTWTPHNAAQQLTITARATATGFAAVTAPLIGSVVPNAAPSLTPNGTVHPYNPQIGGALAPGTIVAIYGSNMASGAAQPTTTPLPTTLNGTTVLIGGKPAPLFYVSASQINAQIPFELDPAKPAQILVNANGALSTPLPLQLSAATPGLDAFGDSTLVAIHLATGALVSLDAPAKTGEFIVMFLLGMGPTDNPVTTGDSSPTSTLNRPLAAPTLTLGGAEAPFAFAGLTPGLVGLYQINLQIPDVPVDGNLVLTVSQNGVVSNTTVLPVVH